MSASSITISYTLQPPADTPIHTSPPSKSQSFDLKPNVDHYASLREAILIAKERLGKELTDWRDVVGDLEKGKDVAAKKQWVAEQGSDDEGDEDEHE